MICQQCAAEGRTSTVHVGMSTRTLLNVTQYYDESGNLVVDDPNVTTTTYSCSNGHLWTESDAGGDPVFRVTFSWYPDEGAS